MANTVSNLDEQVRESLRSRIVSGDLGGGAHLSELRLSKEFNVSRTPIREALCALAADGLIEMVPHRGAFVRTVNETEAADQSYVYGHMMALSARIAVERAGIESLMDLEASINNWSMDNTTEFMKNVESVMMTIRTIAQSSSLEKAIVAVERSMFSTPVWMNEEKLMEEVKQEFTYLLGAFKRQKADAAEKTMRQIMQLLTKSAQTEETSVDMTAMNTTETTALNA